MIHIKNIRSSRINAVRKTDFLRHVPVAIFAAVMSLTSCVKDDLYDTPHPNHGKVAVTADWSGRGDGIAVPDKWTLNIGDYSGEETTATHAPDYLFTPGEYGIIAYNPATDITVSGTAASVASAGGKNGFISNAPGILFTNMQKVAIEKDKEHAFTAVMRQQTGRLTLVIEPTGDAADRIEKMEGSLSGVAGTMDFAADTYGAPSEVALHFTRITEGADKGKWTATVWLLGTAGTEQKLSATITYADSNPQPTALESDLTTALKDFNDNKSEALTLGGSVMETPDGVGVGGVITDWTPGNGEGDDIVAQ